MEVKVVLNFEQKKVIVSEINKVATNALSAVVADYRGLTVAEMTDLRIKARNNSVYLRVIRNTLAKRALEGTEFTCLQEALGGPLVFAFAHEEPGAAAKLFRDFAKDHEALEVKALVVSGQLLPASELDKVAKLPSRDEAIAMLLSVMQAPITKFVRTLAEPHAKLVRTVAAVRNQKEAA
jgi:large subunit ribosomal protein L10